MLIGNTINVNDNKPTVTYNVEIANNDESSDLIIDDKGNNIKLSRKLKILKIKIIIIQIINNKIKRMK